MSSHNKQIGYAPCDYGIISVLAEGEYILQVNIIPSQNFTINPSFAQEVAEKLAEYVQNGTKIPQYKLKFPKTGEFMQKAWQEMQKIPYGKTISYAELAQRAGSPSAYRAAGNACRKNPFPLIIPCHKVLASGGGLHNYAYGLAMKKHLLENEGIIT